MAEDRISAELTSYTCQFCGKTFGRGSELSLHIGEERPDDIGNDR